jgi:hypothetical protein
MNALIPAVERLKASSEQPLRCALDMPAEQFDFFRSWYAGIAEVTLFQEECSSFLARQMVWDFGKLTFIYLTLPYCQFGWRHLSRPTIDNWCLTAEGWLNVKFARPTDRTPTLRNLLLGNYWDRSNDVDRL